MTNTLKVGTCIKVAKNGPTFLYMFVDDCLIFCKVNRKVVRL